MKAIHLQKPVWYKKGWTFLNPIACGCTRGNLRSTRRRSRVTCKSCFRCDAH